MIVFEWDPEKNEINIRKHKISFEEASTVFYDEEAIVFDDPDHSDESEERFIIMGVSKRLTCLWFATATETGTGSSGSYLQEKLQSQKRRTI